MKMMLDRRKFLQFSLMAGMCLPSSLVAFAGRDTEKTTPAPGTIDVHHHIIPPVYAESLAKIGITTTNGAPFPHWNAQQSIDAMDRNGIKAAVTSISSPGVFFGDRAFTVDLARCCNEFSAGLVEGHPKRFGGFAVLPLPDIDAALNEVAHALDGLKLDGVVLLSNVGGTYLGSPEFDDMYAELNRRKAVVYVHPTEPFQKKFPEMRVPPSFFEFMFDTTRAVATLIQYNIPERYPDIRFILAHAGGAAPYLTWKMSLTARYSGNDGGRAIAHLQRFYYDTALSASRYPLGLLKELAGAGRMVFGSDFPFAPEYVMASCLYELDHHDGFDAGALRRIRATNAADLFPRFKAEYQNDEAPDCFG